MIYCRIKLSKTNYQTYDYAYIKDKPNLKKIQDIYKKYCDYKKFKSVQPLFANDIKVHKVMVYYDEGKFVAFSLLYELDKHNIEALQFAWDYKNPKLRLGIKSLENECAWAKANGYKYLYLGQDDRYKSQFKGYERLGPL
jgi:arginyl-tRNA--protein-N-Asp/Glu arginylyltransferase